MDEAQFPIINKAITACLETNDLDAFNTDEVRAAIKTALSSLTKQKDEPSCCPELADHGDKMAWVDYISDRWNTVGRLKFLLSIADNGGTNAI